MLLNRNYTLIERANEFDEPPSNGLPISRRQRAAEAVKMPTISRAKRSAAWAC
jgi:hypothetical protein